MNADELFKRFNIAETPIPGAPEICFLGPSIQEIQLDDALFEPSDTVS